MILAADLQDPPTLVLEMVDHWLSGAKYVVCARADREDPKTAKLFSALYYWLLRVFVVRDYPEGGYDVALMDKQFLPHLQNSSKNIFTPLYAYWLGFKPVVLTYQRRKRLHGRSRWTFAKRLQASFDALLGFSIVPIRMITFIGLIVALTSFVYGGWIALNGLLGRTDVRGFSTVVALISFLQGVTILILGVIGEYVWRIFDETSKRPETVIDEIY
jgi:dolichol-phosphate mannosyltransferase